MGRSRGPNPRVLTGRSKATEAAAWGWNQTCGLWEGNHSDLYRCFFFFFFFSQFLKANWRGDEGGMAFWDSIQGERLMAAGGRSQREEEGALLRL